MRSSKKRSRSNQNRPRTLGNIINRVFDSSGPEGKVRGTPQQIIEKYQMLARDAQLSNDRVAAENFLQHAEHYTRMLAEAQREMAAEQEARQQQYQQNGNGGNGNGNHNGGQNGNRDYRDRDDRRDNRDREDRRDRDFRDPGTEEQPMVVEVIDLDAQAGDSGLVETPEARRREDAPKPNPRRREEGAEAAPRREGHRNEGNRNRPRREPAEQPELPAFITGPLPEAKAEAAPAEAPAAQAAPEAAEAPAEAAAKPRRAPRKPKAEGEGKKEAAE